MLKKGMAFEVIAEVTGLTNEKLDNWKYRVGKE